MKDYITVFFNEKVLSWFYLSFKRCFQKFRKIYRKILVPHSLFLIKLQASGCEISKNTFFYRTPLVAASLTGYLRTTLILKKLNIQTFNSNNSILINLVGTLYLMIRDLNFVFMIDHVFKTQILQSRYYKNNFQYKNVFQGPGFLGSRFFLVQVFQGPGFSKSRSRFQKQPR